MYEDFFFALRNWIFSTRRIFEQREFLKSSISWKFKGSHNFNANSMVQLKSNVDF